MTWDSIFAAVLLAASVPAAAGAEPEQRARSAHSLATLFTDEDYPAEAVRNGEEGRAGFRLDVGVDGRPTGCSIDSSSGSRLLNSTTCRLLMERARFTSARDARGKATTDSVAGAIVWRMPKVPPRLEAARTLWTSCLVGEASKFAPGDLPAAEVARRSFPPCSALERLVTAEVRDSAQLEAARALFRREIEEGLAQVRPMLAAAPEAEED